MKPAIYETSWAKQAWELHEAFCKEVGNVTKTPGDSTDLRFLSLCLTGEVGELMAEVDHLALAVAELKDRVYKLAEASGNQANIVKKEWRDGVLDFAKFADELADCRVYLELLAMTAGVSLEMSVKRKMVEVERRVDERRREREAREQDKGS